jgi:hypothetical protein
MEAMFNYYSVQEPYITPIFKGLECFLVVVVMQTRENCFLQETSCLVIFSTIYERLFFVVVGLYDIAAMQAFCILTPP